MAEKIKENKVVLEREYVVPLRRKFMNTPQYKRTPKAMKALKEFIAKHMKVDGRDVDNVRVDKYLNHELWFKGIRKPLAKVKVKAKKFENGIVTVELAEIPEFLKWKIDKDKKQFVSQAETKEAAKVEVKKEEKTDEEKNTEEEKKKSEVEAGLNIQKQQHTEMKHVQNKEKPQVHRMALQK